MASWDDVRLRLERALEELADDAFVIAGEPEQRRRPTRYVQVRADRGGLLYAECVGSTTFGGDWETTPEQHDRLTASGWYVPGQANPWDYEQSYPNYFRFEERSRADEVARSCVDALQVLGVEPDTLVWRQDH